MSGAMVPGRYSETDELIGIGRALGKTGTGAFGMISDFEDEDAEFEWMTKLGAEIDRPLWFLLTDRAYDPERWRRLLAGAKAAKNSGASIIAQVAGRQVGLNLGLMTSLTPFSVRPSFKELDDLDPAEKLARLRDPEMKRKILDDEVSEELLEILPPLSRAITTRWDRMYPLGDPPNYEPTPDQSVAALAEREGKSPAEFAYDYLIGGDGTRMFQFPVTNYVTGDHEPVREMLLAPQTLLGLSDGGAHCGVICDATVPSFMLAHWGRDRTRGEKLPLEWIIKRQTSETADFFGFKDRGRLVAGKKADLNLIDFANLRPRAPQIVNDLPAGGKRLIQKVDGYEATIVSGQAIFERGVATGARPGKLVRAGR
jgi:N-acyl-D-amino-acid deacylase